MRKIQYILTIGLMNLSTIVLTSCLEEPVPTSFATAKQVTESLSAIEQLAGAMASQQNTIWSDDGFGWGLGSILKIRDLFTGDLAQNESNYDHYIQWEENYYIGESYLVTQYTWEVMYQLILTTNNLIGTVHADEANSKELGLLGAGYAYRAMWYLDMARMYEFLPNDIFPDGTNERGKVVKNLTIPIVTENTTDEQYRNNPRATRQEMFDFILSDLNQAEAYIPNLSDTHGRTLPDISVVYGLKARLYMWVEDYVNAESYARKAIDAVDASPETPHVMTQEECLNVQSGFNQAYPWMLASQQTAETSTVKSVLSNWTSWMSNQTLYGYTSLVGDPFVMIDHAMYDRISNADFRKLWFKAPANSPIANNVTFVHSYFKQTLPTYASVKFRPGDGEYELAQVGSATAYPLMRVEEMYFIEAEAAAHQDPARGKQLAESFVKANRNTSYSIAATKQDDVIEEIVFQKRLELWGEGQSFFDIKRLNYSVKRGYQGTNFAPLTRLNTNGRPAWMNFVISDGEGYNNKALDDWNNPDPSDKYDLWVDPNEAN